MDLDATNFLATEPTAGAVEQAIGRGIAYLIRHQHPNGEFVCYMASDPPMRRGVADNVVFPTALIANSLLSLSSHADAMGLIRSTLPFLQYQLMRGGVANYYTLRSPLFRLHPPDIDTTAYVGTLFNALLVDYDRASTRSLLLTNRRREGGIYTWLTLRPRLTSNRAFWRIGLRALKQPVASLLFWLKHPRMYTDVDGVATSNALAYLGVSSATQPVLDYLLRLVASQQETRFTHLYYSPVTFYYALGRAYCNEIEQLKPSRSIVLEHLLTYQRSDGSFGESSLETAQALSALISWQGPASAIERAAAVLLTQQADHGEWPRFIFVYRDLARVAGWGSEELTTALCLEALASFQRWMDTPTNNH